MKCKTSSQYAFSNLRLLIGLFFVSLSASLTLVGSGAISNGFGDTKESMGSRQIATATPNPQPRAKGAALRDNPRRYLDEKGNRASGIQPGTAVGTKYRGERPVGASAWTSLGPPGGDVFDVAVDPSDSSIIWAGIADASGSQPVNVMRSTDGGATWTDRTPPHAPMSGRAIAVDPNDSNTVIAVFGGDFGGGEVWVTTDGGDSWIDRSAGLPGNPLNAVVYDGTRLLVGGGLLFGSQFVGLYESPDLGVTWTPLHDGTWPVLVVEG